MRVLAAIDTGIVGGPGKGILQLARQLQNSPVHLSIAAFTSRRHRSQEFLERLAEEGVSRYVLRERVRFDPMPLLQLLRIVRQGRMDVFQSHGYKTHCYGLALSRLTGVPWVAVMHGWTREDWKVRLYHRLDSVCLRYADAVVTVSNPLYDYAVRLRGPGNSVYAVPNAVESADLVRNVGGGVLRRSCLGGEQFLLGCFGRLSSEKGQEVLLRAYARFRRHLPPLKLLFVGEGPESASLHTLAKELGVADRVILHGHQRAMRDYFEAIDLLVIPSLSEGMPNVLLEAMALGVPVVATRVGAIPSLIEDAVSGWLCAPGDPAALARGLERALAAPVAIRDEVARVARARLHPQFSPEVRANRFCSVYESVSSSRMVAAHNSPATK